MLSRRHIRLKVMQSLYAYFSSDQSDIKESEKRMFQHFEEVAELYFVILSLLIEIVKYADDFLEAGKQKHLPSIDDLNPNRRFIDNKVVLTIKKDHILIKKLFLFSDIWLKNDHNVVAKLFNQLYKSELYRSYINNQNINIEIDQRFFVNALNDYILSNELVHHIFEERSIHWIDDLPFVAAVIMGDIKSNNLSKIRPVFKDNSDKEFAVQLLRDTIVSNKKYEDVITKFARDWELDRIAIMDQLLLKMAFTEILTMEELPVKVTMNEYIEISKYYSTSKSKLFINGLLDNAVKYFDKEGEIRKVGRGLI